VPATDLRSPIAPALLAFCTFCTVCTFCAMLTFCALQPAAARGQQRSTPPVIVVGVPDDQSPYAYLDREGEPAGFNVAVLRAMARAMGFEVGFVPGSQAEVEEALRLGKIDVVAALPYTKQRDAWADFSAPLLEVEVSGVSPEPATRLCYGVREGNGALRERLDQGIETLRINGQFQKLYDEHIGITRMHPPGSRLAGWLLPMVIVFLLLLMASFAFWLRSAPGQGTGTSKPPAG
jgi:ABC-type amino acid transport substrate-binding protein